VSADRSAQARAQLLGFAGAGLLFLGAFSPVTSVPLIGSQTFMQNGSVEGVLVLACATAAALLALTRKYPLLLVPGGAALLVVAVSYLALRSELNAAGDDIPFAEIRRTALGAVQLQWGWAVLILGALLVIGAALLARKQALAEKA
jgi:hypothetical protein